MTSEPAWVEKARALRAKGMPLAHIARELRCSEYKVRTHLIEGERERRLRDEQARKLRYQEAMAKGEAPTRRVKRPEQPIVVEAKTKPAITLPALSIQAAPIDEVFPLRRVAPKTYYRVEPKGVTRIKQIEAEMLRRGKLPSRDVVSEMHS
jgi:hypothetical protein